MAITRGRAWFAPGSLWQENLGTNAPQFPGSVGEIGDGRRGQIPGVPLRLLKVARFGITVPYSETGILGRAAWVSVAAEWDADGYGPFHRRRRAKSGTIPFGTAGKYRSHAIGMRAPGGV